MKRRGFFGAVVGGALAAVGLGKAKPRNERRVASPGALAARGCGKSSLAMPDGTVFMTVDGSGEVIWKMQTPDGFVVCDGSHGTPQIHPPKVQVTNQRVKYFGESGRCIATIEIRDGA